MIKIDTKINLLQDEEVQFFVYLITHLIKETEKIKAKNALEIIKRNDSMKQLIIFFCAVIIKNNKFKTAKEILRLVKDNAIILVFIVMNRLFYWTETVLYHCDEFYVMLIVIMTRRGK